MTPRWKKEPPPSKPAAGPPAAASPAASRAASPGASPGASPAAASTGTSPPAPQYAPASPRLATDAALHDLTNAIAAARTFAAVLKARTQPTERSIVDSLLEEIDRAGAIVRLVRRGAYDAYARGDVLECMQCGATFVHRKATGRAAACRRCHGVEITRWRPPS